MIDPVDSLAFSIQANPGVYALLLGSGVSRAAQIPTGWEITLDLLRKLAVASGESAGSDPERWYREKYGEDADYSGLIDRLAGTPADRQQLLRGYFEPDEQEREEDAKQPTVAHKAIAELVARGFVRVVITTNFDHLIERALEDAGVSPTVVSSPDHIKGMLPLVHTRHCLIKVNGDYLDTRIRNTSSELDTYPNEFNQLLDQVFDEFGLVVCGWSADWDGALRDALYRAPSRRFTTFWATHGESSEEAQRLASHRRAQIIPIEGADRFFETLRQKIESIEQYSRPHPLSTQAAVTTLKRYLSEPRFRIQRAGLIDESVERVVQTEATHEFDMFNPSPSTETVTARAHTYEATCSSLLAMAATGGRWAEEDHFSDWRRALARLADVPLESGYPIWLGLRRYPAALTLYTLGLAALSSDKFNFLGFLLSTGIPQPDGETLTVAQVLPPYSMFGSIDVGRALQVLEGMDRRHVPLNDWMHGTLRQYLSEAIHNDEQYDFIFDKLEVLLALSYAYHERSPEGFYWAPLGAYLYRTQNRNHILEEFEGSITTIQRESPLVKCGIFGLTPDECMSSIEHFKRFAVQAAQHFGVFR